MIEIKKYVAEDGTEFKNKSDAENRDRLIIEVEKIMKDIPARPLGTSFINGHGYIQHDARKLAIVRTSLLKLIKLYIKHQWVDQTLDNPTTIHPSYVARLLSDTNIKPLDNAWYRFLCIDSKYREWGQPYYANHPQNAHSQECINI